MILATKIQSKSDELSAIKVFNRIPIGRLKHTNWEVKACILDCKSIQIADLLHVNVAIYDDMKAFKA